MKRALVTWTLSVVVATLGALSHGHAQDAARDTAPAAGPAAWRVAWHDEAPRIDGGGVVTVALGVADERRGPLAARRLWARREAEARAREALHAWADAAVARAGLAAPVLAALHHAIDEGATVRATRARVDGSACIEMTVPTAALAAATRSARGLPWS